MLAEAVAQMNVFQGELLDAWLDREWLAEVSGVLRAGATSLVVAVTLALLAMEAGASRPSLPRALYAAGVALMVAAALHTEQPFLFVVIWTGQHWLVATAVDSFADPSRCCRANSMICRRHSSSESSFEPQWRRSSRDTCWKET